MAHLQVLRLARLVGADQSEVGAKSLGAGRQREEAGVTTTTKNCSFSEVNINSSLEREAGSQTEVIAGKGKAGGFHLKEL